MSATSHDELVKVIDQHAFNHRGRCECGAQPVSNDPLAIALHVANEIIAAGWKSPDEVAETREKFARTVTALNGRFQESVTEVVRAAKEATWKEGYGTGYRDGYDDVGESPEKNPYRSDKA